jgi:DNA polymerase IIIc chi subunit
MQAGESLKEVMFHTGVADVPAHIARLAVKVKRSGQTMVVLCRLEELNTIDAALWAFSRASFLPHSRADAPPSVLARSPVALVTSLEQVASLRSAGSASNSRLVSTLQVWVDGCESFDKMIEVVTPAGTADARERWKRYAQMGAVLSNTAVDKLVSNT